MRSSYWDPEKLDTRGIWFSDWAQVQDHLGHAKIETTQIYLHVTQ